ncbi:hypothetical protein PFJ87_11g00780 [Encephalitozoon hellem]|uniref:Uncharacterized protein n=1 Tax=Encephalitozoon hellem TaxID=27973 RepID=A0ABY8CQ73_ENCHE|nr:hypothetical protein PFJ87_11g00780 [Encephalitozoon hellem]
MLYMDAEFISGVVVSYSKLLREISGMKKEIKEILATVRSALSRMSTICSACQAHPVPLRCECLGNTRMSSLDDKAALILPKKSLDRCEVSPRKKKDYHRVPSASKGKGIRCMQNACDVNPCFFKEVEREVCHAQCSDDVSY